MEATLYLDANSLRARCALLLALAFVSFASDAQDVVRTALPADHPLIGAWRIDVPGTSCYEIYDVHADGTMKVTSGEQAAESEFRISATPSAKGFYEWVDKITKDNGKPDCSGEIMVIGHVATNYILVHRSGEQFLMC